MWLELKEKTFGVAIYSFHGDEILPGEGIKLELGDTVIVLYEFEGWNYGYTKSRKDKIGIFPKNYVQIRSGRLYKYHPDAIIAKYEDSVVKECRTVAREWGEILRQLYVSGGQSTYEFDVLVRAIREIVDGRRRLITETLTQDQIREIKLRLTHKIDWKNKSLGLDLVPRTGYEIANPDEIGVVQLYHIHKKSMENVEGGRGTTTRNKKEIHQHTINSTSQKAIGNHLYFSFRGFSYSLNDDCEVYFSLFDGNKMQFVSERFLVRFTSGVSNFVDKLQQHGTTVFEDLGFADLHPELYLVTQVFRIGRMSYSESTKKSNQLYKRPFACGVLNIGDIVAPQRPKSNVISGVEECLPVTEDLKLPTLSAANEEREFTFKLYSIDEKEFSQFHEHLIKKQMGKTSGVSGSFTIVALKLFTGDLNGIRQENPLLFKNTMTTKKLGFPDIIFPGDVRNDFYITLDHGEFEKGGKPTGKSIELSLVVFDGDGNVIPNAVYGAMSSNATGDEEHQSVIYYHNSTPKWNETVRITIPIEKFSQAHLRLEYNHCSTKDKNAKKIFGFSFVRLMDDEGTTIKDGGHELIIYKCEDRTKLREIQNYIKLPFLLNGRGSISGNQMFQMNSKENMTISTLLVSTKLTQNLELVSLLKWRIHPERIKEILDNMKNVSGEEIVKFLQDVLDVLFTIFLNDDGFSNEYSGDVFMVLINIFSLLEEGKYEHFKPVIDAYITNHFAAALVYRGLLSTVQHYANVVKMATKEFFPQIQKCFESLEFIFKFIVQSHILFARATNGEILDSFSRNVGALFKELNLMLKNGSTTASNNIVAEYVPIQSALLYNLNKMYKELLRVMPAVDLANLVCELFTNIPLKESAHPLSPAKLTALHHLVKSDLFKEKECRSIILPEVCKHLRHHLCHRQELKLCTEVLDDILIFLYSQFKNDDNRIHVDVETVAANTLEMLVQSVLILERTSPIVGNLVTCLIGLLQLMDQFHYNRLWDEFRESKPLRDFLLRVFLVFRDLIKHDVYPVDWSVMKLLTDFVMLKSLKAFSQPLILYFLNKYTFDSQIWSQYFGLAVTYLTQPALQLEKFRLTKRENILQKYGDMRVEMGFQILNMWSNLGEYKHHFIPSMVGSFLEVTLVPEMELRKATLSIFYDLLEAEHNFHGDFKQVECELIDKLDMLVSHNKGDDEYRQLFNSILLQKIEENSPNWKLEGITFISSVTRLLERLLDYRACLQGDENRDKRMSCTVNLLNFYNTEINRQEMYMRYIYKLHDLQISAENFTEAGFTLLLHAEKLNWTGDKVPPEGNYPAQTEMERKEDLYLKILNYFDQGKIWEKGIPLCKELANLYEFKFFNYTKLSHILKTEAIFFENILTQLRPEPEYFRVGFYGKNFPLFVRNKEFIYRGLEYERLATFMQRVVTEWPASEILKNIAPDESIMNADGQFLQICNVKPVPDANNPILKASHVPEKIQAYYTVNNVDTFSFDRRLKKHVFEDLDSQNEFKHMWIERTTMRTANPLPGILRWFEIVENKVEHITPVRYATERIEEVNRQLRHLVNQFTNDTNDGNVNPLSMKLQGILDATVMGGLSNYRDAFFTADFLQNNPDSHQHVNKLRSLIHEQVKILESALSIHGKLASPQVQPLHNRLVECFGQMKSSVEADFIRSPLLISSSLKRSDSEGIKDSSRLKSYTPNSNSIVNTPLPPVPLELKRLNEPSSNRSSKSSGYGHVVGTGYFDGNSDEDDVYSKPAETKENEQLIKIINNYKLNNGLANANSEPSLVSPPPIPNRQRQSISSTSSRQSTSFTSGTSSNQNSTSTPYSKLNNNPSSEYIFMPPSRLRELNNERKSTNSSISTESVESLAVMLGVLGSQQGSSGKPNDCVGDVIGCGNGDSMINQNGSRLLATDVIDGPPLPPRSSVKGAGDRNSNEFDGGIEPPPTLPKRHPKKVSSKNSVELDRGNAIGGSGGLASPIVSPTKVGPPIPPKPKAGNRDLSNIDLNIFENYISKDDELTVDVKNESWNEEDNCTGIVADGNTTKIDSPNSTPSSQGITRTSSKTSHKEFFTLPFPASSKDHSPKSKNDENGELT